MGLPAKLVRSQLNFFKPFVANCSLETTRRGQDKLGELMEAVTVAIVSFVGFIVAGFVQNVFVTWAVGIVLLLGALFLIRAIERKKAA